MRLLIFHGYLLRGTGSNVYNAELAEALVRLGHEVHLLCQERKPAELGFVDEVIYPRTLRARLHGALELYKDKRDSNPPKKHTNIPL